MLRRVLSDVDNDVNVAAVGRLDDLRSGVSDGLDFRAALMARRVEALALDRCAELPARAAPQRQRRYVAAHRARALQKAENQTAKQHTRTHAKTSNR